LLNILFSTVIIGSRGNWWQSILLGAGLLCALFGVWLSIVGEGKVATTPLLFQATFFFVAQWYDFGAVFGEIVNNPMAYIWAIIAAVTWPVGQLPCDYLSLLLSRPYSIRVMLRERTTREKGLH